MTMKTIIRIVQAISAVAASALLFSCSETKVLDIEYPKSAVYMSCAASAANEGKAAYELFTLSTSETGSRRFSIDLENDEFVIPLSISRGGVDSKGSITINLAINNDTIPKLVSEGVLGYLDDAGSVRTITAVPADKVHFPETVTIEDGSDIVNFDVVVDFDYLRERVGQLFSVAVGIESATSEVTKTLNTAVMVINTGFMEIVPDFETVQSETDNFMTSFQDLSNGAVAWSWDFGDGSYSQEQNPSHRFTSYGKKTVKLTITGVLGNTEEITKTVNIWEDISEWFFNNNTGRPFEPSAGNVGPPLNWMANDGVLNQEGGLKGWSSWGDWLEGMGGKGGVIQLESSNWNGPGVEDARIWCYKELQPGDYRLIVNPESSGVEPDAESATNPAFLDLYYCAVKGTELCDARTIEENPDVLGKIGWNFHDTPGSEYVPIQTHEMDFTVTETSNVSVGFSLSFGRHGFFRVVDVQLLRLPAE